MKINKDNSGNITQRLNERIRGRFRIKKSRKSRVKQDMWYVQIRNDVYCKFPDYNNPNREDTPCELADLLFQLDGTKHCSRQILTRDVRSRPSFRFNFYTGRTFESTVKWQKRNKDWIQKILTCKGPGHALLEVYCENIAD